MNKHFYLNMPINVFGNSLNNSEHKIDTSLYVQKPYLRTNYIESNFQEDIDLKKQLRIKHLPDPITIREASSKNYVDTLFNDSSILKNTVHIDLNDRNVTNARFFQVNQLTQIGSHLTAKLYVDNSIDEPSIVRKNQDNDFNNYNLTNINSITLNKPAKDDSEVITEAHVDQFHEENERSRRDLGIDFYDESDDLVKIFQDIDLKDKKLTILDSITVNRNPTSNEVSIKKHTEDELDKNTNVRFIQTLQNYLRVSVGNDTYNVTKYNKIQLIDTKITNFVIVSGYLLQNWVMKCNDINKNGKKQNFIKSTKTKSHSSQSGADSLPPISNSFLYIETSSGNHGPNVFVSWERTHSITTDFQI